MHGTCTKFGNLSRGNCGVRRPKEGQTPIRPVIWADHGHGKPLSMVLAQDSADGVRRSLDSRFANDFIPCWNCLGPGAGRFHAEFSALLGQEVEYRSGQKQFTVEFILGYLPHRRISCSPSIGPPHPGPLPASGARGIFRIPLAVARLVRTRGLPALHRPESEVPMRSLAPLAGRGPG